MKKFLKLLTVSVAALSLVGLASCGGSDEASKSEPTESQTVAPTVKPTEPEKTPEPTPEPTKPEEKPEAFMTNTQKTQFGDVTCDVILKDETNAFFDVTTAAEMMNKKFDKEATYTFAENIYTFTIDEKEYKTTYDEATKQYKLEYSITGDMTINFVLVSKAVEAPVEIFMTNTQKTQFGDVTCDVILKDDTNAFFDVTTAAEMMNTKFDKNGTYTFAENVYTFTIDEKEYKTTYDEATKQYKLEYSITGDMTINFVLVSKAVEAPAEIVKLMSDTQSTQFGNVTCDVLLLDASNVKFDVTTAAESMNDRFDKTGTYTLADGIYTFTLDGTEYKTTLADGVSTLEYTITGDMKITFNLTSALK